MYTYIYIYICIYIYRDNLDEEALSKVLRRISRHTIENTLEEREAADPIDEEDDDEEEEEEDEEEDDDDDEVF
jgi:hypothetical protein